MLTKTMPFESSQRYRDAIAAFTAAHQTDPRPASALSPSASSSVPYSVLYHARLSHFCHELCSAGALAPTEALLLAANCQHIKRWEHPRSDYPEGLVGYKTWRTRLNKWHAEEGERILLASGYDATVAEDVALISRFKDLVTKKTLNKDDPEMQLFEDAICCVFLENEFNNLQAQHDDEKIVNIVKKTWAKMGPLGRECAEKLAKGMTEVEQGILGRALAG